MEMGRSCRLCLWIRNSSLWTWGEQSSDAGRHDRDGGERGCYQSHDGECPGHCPQPKRNQDQLPCYGTIAVHESFGAMMVSLSLPGAKSSDDYVDRMNDGQAV